MYFENESPYYSSSPSSSSSPSQLSSPCTPPNPNSPSDSSHTQAQLRSHKKKAGRKKFRETRHPVYRCVRRRNGDRWVCEVREPNKKSRIWLGTYPTPEMAARAHDVAVLALRGTSAVFNFPHSASLLPVARSTSAADIREAASKAADAFRPSTTTPSSSLSLATSSSSANNHFCVKTNPCLLEGNKSQERVLEGDDLVKGTCITNDNEESKSMFFDEEALYNMPGLLDSMAEGLLITPPSMKKALDWDDVDCETDLTLWTD